RSTARSSPISTIAARHDRRRSCIPPKSPSSSAAAPPARGERPRGGYPSPSERSERGKGGGACAKRSEPWAERPGAEGAESGELEIQPGLAFVAAGGDRVHVAFAQDQVFVASDLDLESRVGRKPDPVVLFHVAHGRAHRHYRGPGQSAGRR